MRHQKKKTLKLSSSVQKKANVVRNLLTSLVTYGKMTTTPQKARVLKAQADSFFASLVKMYHKYDEQTARRESLRLVKKTLYTEMAGKKVLGEWLPRYLEEKRMSGFVLDNKL